MDNELPQLLTLPEVADYLRLPRATLYHWRVSRQGPPAVKLGTRLVYRLDHLLAWLEAKEGAQRKAKEKG